MALCVGFASCSGDDDPGTDLSKEAEKFIGGWSSNGSGDFVFCSDGTCISGHNGYMSDQSFGEWTYNEDTKQLATTLDGESWTVSMVTESAWTGVSAKKSKSITYQRDNSYYMECFLDMMKGLDESDQINIQKKALYEAYIEDYKERYGYYPIYSGYSSSFSPNVSSNDIIIGSNSIKATNVEYIYLSQTLFKGSITINNYGKENAKMIIDGTFVPTNAPYKKELSAKYYIKEGKRVAL